MNRPARWCSLTVASSPHRPSDGGDAKVPVGDPQGTGWALCGAVAFGLVLGVGVMLQVGDR